MSKTIVAMITALLVAPGAAQEQTFRASADAVRMEVSVQRQGKPVTGLTAADFEVFDNEIPQRVGDVSYGKLPIDVALALDVSSSVSGQLLNALRQSVEQLKSRLQPGDRLKLMVFNMRVRRLIDFSENVDTQAAFAPLTGNGSTAIFDAMSVALVSEAPADRRQLVIVFSDGLDTSSITDPDVLSSIAQRTTATVAVVGPIRGPTVRDTIVPAGSTLGKASVAEPTSGGSLAEAARVQSFSGGSPLWSMYSRLVAETGGVVVSMPDYRGTNLTNTFGRILDEFRSSYVLYFTPSGVPRKGFHTLRVAVKRPDKLDVRARRGYVEE